MSMQNLLVGFRKIWKHKYYSASALLGLIVGITGFLILINLVVYELSFDQFHAKREQLYRVNFKLFKQESLEVNSATSTPLIGPLLYNELPGVLNYARFYPRFGKIISVIAEDERQQSSFNSDRVYQADSSVFEIFSFELKVGDKDKVLRKPFTAVISESLALKIFGENDPVGAVLKIDEDEKYLIEGIFEDVPSNSHLQFEALLSISSLEQLDWSAEEVRSSWGWYSFLNYIEYTGGADTETLNKEIRAISSNHTRSLEERINGRLTYELIPLEDVYLNSSDFSETPVNGSKASVLIMSIVGVILLIISFINYFNIISMLHCRNAKNDGIRKILGNNEWTFLKQYFIEICLHIGLTLLASIGLVYLFWSDIQYLLGNNVPILITSDLIIISMTMGSIFMLAFLIAVYRVMSLVKLSMPSVIKGNLGAVNSPRGLSNIILGLQFFFSTGLLIGTLLLNRQLSFIQEYDPGFDIGQMIAIKVRNETGIDARRACETLLNELTTLPEISGASMSGYVPGDEVGWTNGARLPSQNTMTKFHHYPIDHRFFDQFTMDVIAGRNFTNTPAAANQVIINEEGARRLGYDRPVDIINKTFEMNGDVYPPLEIIGVVKDFYQDGMKKPINPIAFHFAPINNIYTGAFNVTFRYSQGANEKKIMNKVKAKWELVFGGREMEYKYLSTFYNDIYKKDQQSAKSTQWVAIMAIILSILGIIGLLSFSAMQRTKEIGVRKVLGGSEVSIQWVIGKSYLGLALFSSMLALPVTYLLVRNWLNGFEYRISNFEIDFLIGFCSIMMITALTIVIQTNKYVSKNPVHSIRMDD